MKTLVLWILVLTIAFVSSAQNVNIPDANFKNALISTGVDTNGDGEISYAEAEAIISLDVSHKNISDIIGIEAFVNLDTLNCSVNQLTSLDVSNNTALTELVCYTNQLTSLDVSSNTALTGLAFWDNQLTSLDVSSNTALTSLECGGNQLTSLDVSNNTDLTMLYCYKNQLTSLDVSNNTALTILYCDENQLTSLDISKNTVLSCLLCRSNQLTSLDVSKNVALYTLRCGNNLLTSLDISNNVALGLVAGCRPSNIILDISYMPSLHEVCVWEIPFPPAGFEVDTTNSPNVYFTTECVYVDNVFIPDTAFLHALIDEGVDINGDSLISYAEAEAITYLDVEGDGRNPGNIADLTGIESFVNLEGLSCTYNNLTSMDISKNTAIIELFCHSNQLTSLDVSNNPDLEHLICWDNLLTSLDVSGNTALTSLHCSDNQLTSMDISKNTAIIELFCHSNQLTSLDVSNNTALRCFGCADNQLTSLDVTNNTSLNHFDCSFNLLTTLDISNNIAIGLDGCWANFLNIGGMPSLYEVCVWNAFSLDSIDVDTSGSPNVSFTTECSITALHRNEENSTINIYPNPSADIINIKIENINNATIEIYNVSGTLIFSKVLDSKFEKIDVSDFSKGIYIVKVMQDSAVNIGKVVVR